MKALILAGGFGTRLKSITGEETPKPMVLIAGKPFLEYQIKYLKENGIKEIILAIHHHADKIKSYFGAGHRFGVDITYSEEDTPLGTAGAIKKAEKYIDNTFMVLNGDSYSNVDISKFLDFHKSKRSNFSIALTKPNESGMHYGNVVLNEEKITNFNEKIEGGDLINSGVYIFEPSIFDYIEKNKNVSIEKEVFPKLANSGLLWGFYHEGYFRDIGRPETYNEFKKDILEGLFLKGNNKVEDAMKKITSNGIDLILVVDDEKKLLGVLNDKLIKNFILGGGNISDSVTNAMITDPLVASVHDSQEKINEILLAGTYRLPIVDDEKKVVDVEFHVEKIKTENFPIVRGKSPLRISFAGGGTDIPHFFEKYGGVVINATIDKYCHVTLIKRADKKIVIDSDTTDETDVVVNSIDELIYDGKFDLIKAIVKLMKPDFGFEIYLHNDIPPGRGLGSSASFSVLIISLLNYLQGNNYDDYKIAEIAHKAETEELKIKGGWQDQYAAVTGGFNFMEFNGDKTLIYPLRLKEEVINELNHHLLLCYVGKTHFSGEIHESQEKSFLQNEEEKVLKLNDLKKITIEIRDCLLTNNIEKIGELLHTSWECKKSLDSKISNQNIDNLYKIGMQNGAYGGKLLGAGGGGYILFFYSPKKRNQLKSALEKFGGEIMNFNFEFKGTQIWPSKNRF